MAPRRKFDECWLCGEGILKGNIHFDVTMRQDGRDILLLHRICPSCMVNKIKHYDEKLADDVPLVDVQAIVENLLCL